MKTRLEMTPLELYALSMDVAIKYQVTPIYREFMKKFHLKDFVVLVSWRVVHSILVREAIAFLDPKTWITTVKGENIPIIAKNLRKQF